MPPTRTRLLRWLALPVISCSLLAFAETSEFEIVIREHRFEPAVVEIPAGQKVKLLLRNTDDTPEEFESYELRREKVIAGASTAIIYVGPLKPGEYLFFGEFNPETARGRLIVR